MKLAVPAAFCQMPAAQRDWQGAAVGQRAVPERRFAGEHKTEHDGDQAKHGGVEIRIGFGNAGGKVGAEQRGQAAKDQRAKQVAVADGDGEDGVVYLIGAQAFLQLVAGKQ